jgi:hypothetical protein
MTPPLMILFGGLFLCSVLLCLGIAGLKLTLITRHARTLNICDHHKITLILITSPLYYNIIAPPSSSHIFVCHCHTDTGTSGILDLRYHLQVQQFNFSWWDHLLSPSCSGSDHLLRRTPTSGHLFPSVIVQNLFTCDKLLAKFVSRFHLGSLFISYTPHRSTL